jgi:tetratricopeptide (TPR) repeat protein
LTPLVGRKSELAQLSDAWSEAARGQRRMVLLRGEPGIGKSRLALALREHLADRGQPHLLHEMRCFPETAQSPLHPLIAMVVSLFGFLPGDPASKLCARLEAYLDAHFSPSKSAAMPLLLALLSLPADPRYPLPDLPPRRLKDATHALLLDLLGTEALRQPVLLIVEDLHWIDPSTRELLDLLVAREQPGALLGLFTTRPEFASTWPEHLVTPLPLAPLREAEVAAMVDALVTDLPAAARASIVQRADGIPLFAEEMSKMSRADPNAGVPSTLLDLLASRIDTLGEAKTCAQLAATLGREFDLNLLQAISPHPPSLLRQHLHALQEAGLVLPDMHDTGQFKHALIQEAAYQSQAKATRVAAHRRIADVLQNRFKDTAANQPEILAQHLAAGGEPLQAIDYWIMAARRAASLCANLEATAHFVAALDVAATLPAGLARDGVEFNLRVGLAPVLCATKGYGAQEVARNNARVGELAEVIDDNPALFPAKWAMTIGTIGSVGSRGMAQAVAQLLESARGDPVRQIAAHFLGSNASLWLGDFAACIHHDDQIVALYRPEFQASLVDQFGSDLSVFSADHAGFALWLTGFAEQAQVRMDRALERARAGAHPHTLSQALVFTAVHKRWSGGPETAGEAKALAAHAIEIARHHDMPLWIASAGMTHGWACAMLGDVEAGIAEARDAIVIAREALSAIAVVYIAPLIEVYIHLARHDEALTWVEEAQAQADISGDGHYTAELLRLKGEALLGLSAANARAAEACFRQALAVSHQQRAKALELRAAMSMARLWQSQGKTTEAQVLLTGVYGRFTEGFGSYDVRQAKALISNLAPNAGTVCARAC